MKGLMNEAKIEVENDKRIFVKKIMKEFFVTRGKIVEGLERLDSDLIEITAAKTIGKAYLAAMKLKDGSY